MAYRMMFVSGKKSLIASALCKSIEWSNIKVDRMDANSAAILAAKNVPKVIIFFLDGNYKEFLDLFGDIKKYMYDNDIRLVLVDNPSDKGIIAKTFLKPFNSDDIIDTLKAELGMSDSKASRKKILIVDDDETFLRAMKDLLSGIYRINIANSGANALQMIAENPVDLILLDYEMPVLDGPQVLFMLRNDYKTAKIPVMFLTAKNNKESILKIMSLHPEAYILKSSPKGEIIDMIDKYFEKKNS